MKKDIESVETHVERQNMCTLNIFFSTISIYALARYLTLQKDIENLTFSPLKIICETTIL